MRNRTYIIILAALLLTGTAFIFGLLAGRDTTVVSFRGLPDDTVIHFEVEKTANNNACVRRIE